jgi:hypothetical protein
MMKFSATTAALIATTAIVGSVSAMDSSVEFSAPIAFTQHQDDCDGTKLYEGLIDKITMLDMGSFCVVDTITSEDGLTTETAYSKLEVVSCNTDKVYDHWSKCTDDTCSDCTMEYRSFTAWESHDPDDMMDHCYIYNFSMDDHTTVKDSRNAPMGVTVGTFDDIMTVAYNFDTADSEEDVAAYMNFVKDNSCIALGAPMDDPVGTEQDTTVNVFSKDTSTDSSTPEDMVLSDPVLSVSAGNAVAFSTAGLIMTFAASIMLA